MTKASHCRGLVSRNGTHVTCADAWKGVPGSTASWLMAGTTSMSGGTNRPWEWMVVGSGSSGTHGGLVAGFLGNHIRIPIVGIGVSRDPADQQPLVMKEAQAVADLLGLGLTVKAEDVTCVGGYWQPKYSVPNAKMVEAVQLLARTEAIPLDPVYTGKIMAGLIGLARQGFFKPGERVLFLHTGGLPSLHAYEAEVLGRVAIAA